MNFKDKKFLENLINKYSEKNSNNISYPLIDDVFSIADSYKGTVLNDPIPLNFETVRIMCGLRFNTLKVNVNTSMKVFIFDVSHDNIKLNFISSAYVS